MSPPKSSLKEKIISISREEFFRSVGVLVGGTAFSQLLSIIALPLLTRLYTPDDFSLLAVYISIITIISVAASLRLDIAIPLPKSDFEAIHLLVLAILFGTATTGLVFIAIVLIPEKIIETINQPALLPYLYLLPLGIWLTASYSAIQFWATRKKKFGIIAITRVSQTASGIGTQLSLGWLSLTPLGLLAGQMINGGAGFFLIAHNIWKEQREQICKIKIKRLRATLRRHSNFPKYSTLEALTNSAGIQLPLIIIASIAAGPEAGFLMLAMRVMQAPMGMIGSATAQIYLSQAPEEIRKGKLAEFTEKTIGHLINIGVGPLIFGCLIAPNAFSIIFGEEWRRAGEIATWLTLWLAAQFIASPVSMVMHICNKQKVMLLLTVGGLFLRCGSVIAGAVWVPEYTTEIYALSGAIFYTLCLIIFTRTAGITKIKQLKSAKKGIFIIFSWFAIAILANIIFEKYYD